MLDFVVVSPDARFCMHRMSKERDTLTKNSTLYVITMLHYHKTILPAAIPIYSEKHNEFSEN